MWPVVAGTWKKSPPELVERFDDLMPQTPQAERRLMFGYPCAFVGGHMFMGLFEDRLVLRLPPADRDKILDKLGGEPFEPTPGRRMKEYVVLPQGIVENDDVMGIWVSRALAYARTLPPKKKKADPQD